MRKIIDLDWNMLYIYEGKVVENKEYAMVLRNLKNYELISIGNDAKTDLAKDENLLAIVPIEDRKVISYENLNLLLNFVIKKYKISNPILVDRYNLDKDKIDVDISYINEIEFMKKQTNKDYYVELRNNETVIFNSMKKNIFIDKTGYYKLLNYIHKYFYLNYNGLLNTKKTMELLDNIKNNIIEPVFLKQMITGKNIVIEHYDVKELTNEIIVWIKSIKNRLNDNYDSNEIFREMVEIKW